MRKREVIKNEIKNLKVQIRRKEKNHKEKQDIKWIIKIMIIAFLISLLFSFVSEVTLPNVNFWFGIILIFVFIFIGVIFDIIGVAVTSSDEKPFHSMSSRKVKGADVAVKLKSNADKVSSFCNDVVGDICGIVSGSAGVIIALTISKKFGIDKFVITLIVTAIIASLTIGSKAIGKSYAINKSNLILYRFAKTISYVYKIKK